MNSCRRKHVAMGVITPAVAGVAALAMVLGGCSSSTGPSEHKNVAPEVVLVPAGSFTMGDGSSYCGQDEREVTLTRSFHLFQHEVTNAEYIEALQWAYDNGHVTVTMTSVVDALDGSTEELVHLSSPGCEIAFSDSVFSIRAVGVQGLNPDHPVKAVTWYGAVRYCDWLSMQEGLPRAYEHSGDWACNAGDPYGATGYRLPTDAEWEFAAQFDDERIYPWGNQAYSETLANYEDVSNWTTPVGTFPAAPESLGLSDMAGNIMEWCNDWHVCDVGALPATDPVGPVTGDMRMLHGGDWNGPGTYLTCAIRRPQYPDVSAMYIGFRAARTVTQ